MKIVKMKIDDLIPAKYNPRKDLKPGDREYEKLKKSILEFDYIDPIIVNIRNNIVVGGHQRLKVLKELGWTEVDVSVVDLDDKREKALNIALNKNAGAWDFPVLKDLLLELDCGMFDIEITGFDEKEIEKMVLKDTNKKGNDDKNENKEAESEKENHQIICPSCRHEFSVFTIANDKKGKPKIGF